MFLAQCHICDQFVVFSSLFFPFFSGFCCFPPSTKSNISKVELSAVLQKQCKEKGEGEMKVVREVTVEGGMRELFKVLGIFKLWKKIYIYIKGHRCCNASSIATVQCCAKET